jgi:Spy/CpxP family protein refolding chaperone
MKTLLVMPLVAGLIALTAVNAAEKKGSASADYPFWTAKKRGYVTQFVPGLNAVLQLTDAQREQIAAAREEMANNEEVKAARGIPKSDLNVTAEQRDKARAVIEAAATRLHEKVAGILTPGQKELIEKINAAYASAVEDVGIVYADKFASVKADEAARRRIQDEKNQDTEEQFLHKLDGILTPSQKEAMTHAAEEEEQRNANDAAAKKPAKQ